MQNAQTRIWIPTPYFCVGQESESESVPVSESGSATDSDYWVQQ